MSDVDPQILGELERKTNNELLTTMPLFALSVAIPIAAWQGVLQYDSDAALWFQRSGSLMVLFAVWVEYKLFKLGDLINPTSEDGITFQDLAHRSAQKAKYGSMIKTYKYITALLAISGTIIWGYGDIIRGFCD